MAALGSPAIEELCEVCRNINLNHIFGDRLTYRGRHPDIEWDWRVILRNQKTCALCRLVAQAVQSISIDGDLRAAPFIKGKVEVFGQHTDGFRAQRLVLSAESSSANWEKIYISVQALPFDGGRNLFRGRKVDPLHANIDLIRSWLSLCRGHRHQESGKALWRPIFRLIDVQESCIRQGVLDPEYAALSYVWGNVDQLKLTKSTYSDLERVGALSRHDIKLPKTIRDAIYLCRALNIRYLWVDALCIIQDDPEDKRDQITSMDDIYQCASITIAATSGTHSDAGLPGINSQARRPQCCATVEDRDLVTTQRQLLSPIDYSPWSQRGWTLQENILSKRVLFFTDAVTIFRCQYALWCEDTILEEENAVMDERECLNPTSAFHGLIQHAKPTTDDDYQDLQTYQELVVEYLTRSLSYDDDILNALLGVMRASCPVLGSYYWGMPTKYFAQCLLWSNQYAFNRRQGFPSWSWSGWHHPKGVENGFEFYNGNKQRLKWGPDGTIADAEKYLGIPTFSSSETLFLWTYSAMLSVEDECRSEEDQIADAPVARYHVKHADQEIGSILLQKDYRKRQPEKLEFIEIAYTTTRIDLMLIEWVDDIAYRVQMLFMANRGNWEMAKPERMMIKLG